MAKYNLLYSTENICLFSDFIDCALKLEKNSELVTALVTLAQLEDDNRIGAFLFELFDYIKRAYRGISEEESQEILSDEIKVMDFIKFVIDKFNELTNSSYNALHGEIWYASLCLGANVKDYNALNPMINIMNSELFDDCEILHKKYLLTVLMQLLLDMGEMDIESLSEASNKLKNLI